MQETQEIQVQSLGQEDPLEEDIAVHSSNLAWRIPWTEEPGGLQSMDGKELDMTEATQHTHSSLRNKFTGSQFQYLLGLEISSILGEMIKP